MVLTFKKLFASSWFRIFCCFALLEMASLSAFSSVWLERIFFAVILAIAAALTIRKIEYGVYLLLGELIVGGLGYLLFFPLPVGAISLRLGLFLTVFFVWLIKWLKSCKFDWLRDLWLIPLVLTFVIFAIAIIEGLANGYTPNNIFSDFNGYLYFALIGLFAISNLELKKILQLLFAGSLVLGLKTIIILFVFSHGWATVGQSFIYHWIRDTGVGEITLINYPLFRVFFQSHFYNLLALIFGDFILLLDKNKNHAPYSRLGLWLLIWLNFFVIVISQSRSFWVAGLTALAIFLPLAMIYFKVGRQKVIFLLILIPIFAVSANFAGQLVLGNWQVNFFTGRISGIAGSIGVSSRLAQLQPALDLIDQSPLLGHGFGATVRYRSDDPRIKNQSNPEGWTDAPALEWGYLDLAVKAGLIGLAVYLFFLSVLAWQLLIQAQSGNLLSAGLLLGLLTLMIIHIFTPYLNHPLGIGYVLAVFGLSRSNIKPPA